MQRCKRWLWGVMVKWWQVNAGGRQNQADVLVREGVDFPWTPRGTGVSMGTHKDKASMDAPMEAVEAQGSLNRVWGLGILVLEMEGYSGQPPHQDWAFLRWGSLFGAEGSHGSLWRLRGNQY